MKNKVIFILVFLFFQTSSQLQSEVTERQIFTELFMGCVQEGDPDITLGAQFEYCACIISSMSTGLTYDELMFIVDSKQTSIIDEKLNKFAQKCAEKLYQ